MSLQLYNMSNNYQIDWKKFQKDFLNELEGKIGELKLVNALADLLGISTNAAYKKIQCNTQLSIQDILPDHHLE